MMGHISLEDRIKQQINPVQVKGQFLSDITRMWHWKDVDMCFSLPHHPFCGGPTGQEPASGSIAGDVCMTG
jgi:hypothetical protein